MKIKKAIIENFKGIEHCEIEFGPDFNLLIGDNGVGKTSVLEALSVGLGGFIAGIGDVKTKHFTKDEIRIILENTGDGSYNRRYMTPVSVKCCVELEDQSVEWVRRKNSLTSSRSTVEPRTICKIAEKMANEPGHILPIISYQSTARMWMQKKESSENIFSGKFYRTVGYENCLEEASNIKMLMNWIRHMEKLEWRTKKNIAEYRGVMACVLKFMRIMEDEEILGVQYDDQSDELVFVTKSESLPIRALSSGYQSLIWMVLDIAYRMALLNPDLKSHIADIPGIIMVDELDMHLHPKWQWNVILALRNTFPNVQFIAATHSPIIISSCKDETLIRINKAHEIVYDKTPYGMDINETLSMYQDSRAMAQNVEKLLECFYHCIDNDEFESAETYLQQLIDQLGENHPKVTGAKVTLNFEKMPLEE